MKSYDRQESSAIAIFSAPQKTSSQLLILLAFCFLFLSLPLSCEAVTAAWLIRFDIATPSKIERQCKEAKLAGFDSLLVQVRGRADAFYTSRLAPRSEYLEDLPDNFDPLRTVQSQCAPIPVHAWLNVYYLWTGDTPPQSSSHPAARTDWILHDANNRSVAAYNELERNLGWIEGIYADPASEAYRRLMVNVVKELVHEYKVKEIHLDFVRYPGLAYGRSGPLAKKFLDEFGIDPKFLPVEPPDLDDWLQGKMTLGDRILTTALLFWADMRATQITRLVSDIKTALKNSEPESRLSAAVVPDAGEAFLQKGQDWQTWARKELVDSIYPMAYFGEVDRIAAQLADIKKFQTIEAPHLDLYAGLGAYIKEPGEIATEAAVAAKIGYNNIALFSLGHLSRKKDKPHSYTRVLHHPVQTEEPPATTGNRKKFEYRRTVFSDVQSHFYGREKLLAEITHKALGGRLPPMQEFITSINNRWREFYAVTENGVLTKAVKSLRTKKQVMPPELILSGFFKYVHPLDSDEKRTNQLNACLAGRQQVLSGKKFAKVARQISQGGTRSQGGPLGKRYVSKLDSEGLLLNTLSTGSISPVIETGIGYWCYLIREKKVSTRPVSFRHMDWPAKRIVLREYLADTLK